MNYVLDYKFDVGFNAGSKAREDVNTIMVRLGFSLFTLNLSKSPYKFFHSLFEMLKILKIPSKSSVMIQYPIYNTLFSYVLILILKMRNINIILLIHDLDSFRLSASKQQAKYENKVLYKSNYIICHTDSMRMHVQNVTNSQCYCLWLFDYLTEDKIPPRSYFNNDIIFAGNLSKSTFIQKLDKIDDLTFLVYGAEMGVVLPSIVTYKGCFPPSNVSFLNDGWGLVWDGTSTETCSGQFGNYLKINSPHKASLYLAAHIPLIVWKNSAIAEFVKKNHLGVCVDSLSDISITLSSLSQTEKKEIFQSVLSFGSDIRQGHRLSSIIEDILY